MLKKKRTRNNDPTQSDGEVAWRKRFIDLYDNVCQTYDSHRLALEAIDGGDHDKASEILERLVSEYEDDVRRLVN
jgi:DNA-binding GntR family transcriptional regulator